MDIIQSFIPILIGWVTDKDFPKFLENVAIILSPVFLFWISYKLKLAADVQYAATLMTAFQDEWHSKTAIQMRAFIQTNSFRRAFNDAIGLAYIEPLDHIDIGYLLEEKNLRCIDQKEELLLAFHDHLKKEVFEDPIRKGGNLFSGYDAIYSVLLSFDRLALLCDEPQAMKKFIRKYRPPLRDFSGILQAYIAVRIILRKKDEKNYKKDYMQLLDMLGLADRNLYRECRKALMNRGEWTFADTWRVRIRGSCRWIVEIINKPIWWLKPTKIRK